MKDITELLFNTMSENKCNPLLAFLIITDRDGVSHVQENKSKPSQQPSRGLCNSGNININK